MNMNRRHHPQVIRAEELARAAGLNPYAQVECKDHGWQRSKPVYKNYMDAAFDEHFARVAVDNIYWDQGGSWYTDRWDIPDRDGDCHCWYGRCKSGNRWFWYVRAWVIGQTNMLDGAFETHGLAGSEAEALAAGTEAIKGHADGRRTMGSFQHGCASSRLKQINKAKREARWADAPTDGSDARAIEYLYNQLGDKFRITKKPPSASSLLKRNHTVMSMGKLFSFRVTKWLMIGLGQHGASYATYRTGSDTETRLNSS
jgi:hypothetical protein